MFKDQPSCHFFENIQVENEPSPFDLERAKAGDEILAIDKDGKIHRAIYQGYYEETSGIIVGLPDSDNERAANVHKSSLRMKYPPKVQHG